MINCQFDIDGCLVCPELPAVSAVAPAYTNKSVIGWDAGANSVAMLSGDVAVNFTMAGGITGAVVGFKGNRDTQTNPSLITHGWYFAGAAGHDTVQPMESGVLKGTPRTRISTDTFTIARNGITVVYLVSGKLVYISATPSTGAVLVNACLYTSGDTVGAGA